MWEQQVAFWILAVAMGGAAIGVVRTKNVVHAALFLVVVLAGAAALYILLAAEFVAWVQVLIYIGAVVILFLFGIMLTRAPMRGEGATPRQRPALGGRRRRAVRLRRADDDARRRVRGPGDPVRPRARRTRAARPPSEPTSSARTSCRSRSSRCCCWPRSSAPSSWREGTEAAMELNQFLILERVPLLRRRLRRARASQRRARPHERRAHAERREHQPRRVLGVPAQRRPARSSLCS